MATRKKVFLATDRFITTESYYVLATDVDEAEESAQNTDFPEYLPQDDPYSGYLGCEIDEDEVKTTVLVKSDTLGRKRPYRVRLIETTSDQQYYRGYRVTSKRVEMKERSYPCKEWRSAE